MSGFFRFIPVLFLLASPFGLVVADDALTSPPAAGAADTQTPEQGQDAQPQDIRQPESADQEDAEEDEQPDDIAAEQDEDEEIAADLDETSADAVVGADIKQGLELEFMEEEDMATAAEAASDGQHQQAEDAPATAEAASEDGQNPSTQQPGSPAPVATE